MATLKELLSEHPNHHLKQLAHRFADENTPVHPRMADDPDWMNSSDLPLESEAIHVRYHDAVHTCRNLRHLDRILSEGGLIVPKPGSGA